VCGSATTLSAMLPSLHSEVKVRILASVYLQYTKNLRPVTVSHRSNMLSFVVDEVHARCTK
jgi:hypothetical protein